MIAQVKPCSALSIGAIIIKFVFDSQSIRPNAMLKTPLSDFNLHKIRYQIQARFSLKQIEVYIREKVT